MKTTDWMQTYTGRAFYPMEPDPDMVDPTDIAHALGHLCRYNGHVSQFYSVAEHCVLMSYAVAPENALWALLHDATEAYVGDMVSPLKRSMPEFRLAERRVSYAICHRFGISTDCPEEVKQADTRILWDERDALFGPAPLEWGLLRGSTPLGVTIRGLSPRVAKSTYAMRLEELWSGE